MLEVTKGSVELGTRVGPMKLETRSDVWPPMSAPSLIETFHKAGVYAEMYGKNILDVGCGSGPLGTAAAMSGAAEVWFLDYVDAAVELSVVNAKANLNGHAGDTLIVGQQSDRYTALAGHEGHFDEVHTNPPVQPALGVHVDFAERWSAAPVNESGADGRFVLDAVLTDTPKYLKQGGKLRTSMASRHGHRKSTAMLDQYWGEGNWGYMSVDEDGNPGGEEHTLIPEYHGPYMDTWHHLQVHDLDMRVWQKDTEGKPYAEYDVDPEKADGIKRIQLVTMSNETVRVETSVDGSVRAFRFDGEQVTECTVDAEQLPQKDSNDEAWYYRYYVVEATKV